MAYLVALIVAVGVAYLVWKAFGPQTGSAQTTSSRRGPIGPDDDPDFLLDLGNDRRPRSGGAAPHHDEPETPAPDDAIDPDAGEGPTGGAGRRDDPRPGTTA